MATSKHPEMEHKVGAVNQSARDNPLTGSALQALVRGWMAETAGLPSLIEKGARYVDKYTTLNPDLRAMKSTDPVLPSGEFYREWLPGKQVGDEALTEVGGLLGGVGMGTIAKGVARAPGALTKVAGAAASNAAVPRMLSTQAGVIKAPGGNWLSGSVEDALKGLKRPMQMDTIQAQRAAGIPVDEAGIAQNTGLNSFIDKQLTRYVKNDMATERDPIRALAEQGITHADSAPFGPVPGEFVSSIRKSAGFPTEGFGKSDAAKTWENVSDAMTRQKSAGSLLGDADKYRKEELLYKDPWLSKANPDTTVYQAKDNALSNNLGFDHLADELRNAMNPDSGLPRHLQLKPESLNQVSVPQAVELVSKINKWRAEQKVAANQAVANNPATFTHKEYPDTGFKWVELKQPEVKTLEGLSPEQRSWYDEYLAGGVSPGQALKESSKRGRVELQKALKYEGDTMGHCVGGYCDDVASGKSRIFSLRDAKGQPHVTIEAKLGAGPEWAGEKNKEIIRLAEERGIQRYMAPGNEDLWAEAERNLAARGIEQPKYIQQIKGKGNRKPNDEYLPFVQDFVKSGKWSDVGDLNNTGLQRADWQADTHAEMTKHGIQAPAYGTPDEINAAINALNKAKGFGNKGFAKGGPVKADCGCEH